jgi:transketolase
MERDTRRRRYGAPTKEGTAAAHGEPLGEAEIKATKRIYGWPEDAKFLVPEGVREHFRDGIGKREVVKFSV